MEEADIINEVLLKLDGWVLTDTDVDTPLDFNKKISENEIIDFYNTAKDYAISYLQKNNLEEVVIIDTALILWCAGLLWNKYNIRSNNQVDETYPIGYGDKLIIQAKEMLKPYKSYSFYVY